MFVVNLVGRVEHTHSIMKKMSKVLDKSREATEDSTDGSGDVLDAGALDDLKKHKQFLCEIILVRYVENYLNYLSTLLRLVFLGRPEVLRSSEKVELSLVLRHNSLDDLVKTIAERQVESLSYKSFGDLAAYFEEKFKIELTPASERQAVIEAIETRNISVHNRCIVNQRFLDRTGLSAPLGSRRGLDLETVTAAGAVLTASAVAVDAAVRRKLKLRGVQFEGRRSAAVP